MTFNQYFNKYKTKVLEEIHQRWPMTKYDLDNYQTLMLREAFQRIYELEEKLAELSSKVQQPYE